jgi:hypothetical protein
MTKGEGRGRNLIYINSKWLMQDGWHVVMLLHVKCTFQPNSLEKKITKQNLDVNTNTFKLQVS